MLMGLFSDYGDIFGRMIKSNLMNNQIRATLAMDTSVSMNQESQQRYSPLLTKPMSHLIK